MRNLNKRALNATLSGLSIKLTFAMCIWLEDKKKMLGEKAFKERVRQRQVYSCIKKIQPMYIKP